MLKDDKHYNCIVRDDQDLEYRIYANQMHNLGLDLFKGWSCDAGVDRILIDVDGSIWNGECFDKQLGTWDDWRLLDSHVCRRDRCTGCTDDLMTRKSKWAS